MNQVFCLKHSLIALLLLCAAPCCVWALSYGGSSKTAALHYPDRPIRFIVSFPPGGGADTIARVIGQKLTDVWHQQIVIDNRAGAGGNFAAELAAKAAPDGYTLLQSTVGHAISTSLYAKLGYDLKADFVPVTELASTPFMLVVKPGLTATSVADLIALAKASPGSLNYASSGNGGPSHLAMELFKSATHIDARHIPYKGAAQTITDLLGGQVDMMFTTIPAVLPLVKTGRIHALGVASLKRTPTAPNVPTIDEAGVKGFEASTWYGVQVPKGTPQAIISSLYTEMTKILRQPDVKERLGAQGFDLIGSSPAEFSSYVNTEIAKWAVAVKASGARVE